MEKEAVEEEIRRQEVTALPVNFPLKILHIHGKALMCLHLAGSRDVPEL